MSNSEDHAVRDHATLGGSTAHRWVPCPGSVFLYKNLPPEKPSEAAKLGTQAHEIVERAASDNLLYRSTGNLTVRPPAAVDPEMLEAATEYSKIIYETILQNSITGKAYGFEERFAIDDSLDMYGYVDFWAVYIDNRGKRAGNITDFKFGYVYVDEKNNAQLAFYALALREEMRRNGKDLDYVRAGIFQPRAPGDNKYRETVFTSKNLDAWNKKFRAAAYQIFVLEKPKFKVGDHCQWCRAQAICPKYSKELAKKSALLLVEPDMTTLPDVATTSRDVIGRIALNSDSLIKYIKRCVAFTVEQYIAGSPIPGTKCVATAGKRTWIEDEEKITTSLVDVGLVRGDLFNQKLKGIGEVEKLLSKLHGKEDAQKVTSTLTTKTKPGVLVVPESDKREAITGSLDLLTEE